MHEERITTDTMKVSVLVTIVGQNTNHRLRDLYSLIQEVIAEPFKSGIGDQMTHESSATYLAEFIQ